MYRSLTELVGSPRRHIRPSLERQIDLRRRLPYISNRTTPRSTPEESTDIKVRQTNDLRQINPLLHLLPTLSLTNHLGQRIPVHRTHIRLPAELVLDGARGVEGHVYTRGVSAGGAVDWSSAPGVGFFRELLDVSDIPARDMGLGMSETAGK